MRGSSILLGRRRFHLAESDASMTYELRVKPENRENHGSLIDARVTLDKIINPDNTVNIKILEANGEFQDGTELNAAHLEIRHRTMIENSFWIDSGQIVTEKQLAQHIK